MAESIYLKPGEWHYCEQATVIETVLGSCVGIVMRNRAGATCVAHCILPEWDGDRSPDATGKYVDRSISEMVHLFARRGTIPSDLQVKLFGGAGILGAGGSAGVLAVGRNNVEMALKTLDRAGIPVVASQVGGNRGRKIIVDSGTGTVLVRALGVPHDCPAARKDKA